MTVFNPSRVGLVDARNGTILIRGNYPLDADGNWAYGALKAALQGPLAARALNPDLDAYALVDLAILSNSGCPLQQGAAPSQPAGWGEYPALQRELETFAGLDAAQFPFNSGAYPPPGSQPAGTPPWTPAKAYPAALAKADPAPALPSAFTWWPLEATDASVPADANEWDQFVNPRDAQPASFQPGQYGFAAAVAYLQALMAQPADPPRAIYVHCSEGADRTGALMAGYLLRQYPAHYRTADAAIQGACAAVRADFPPPNANYCALLKAYQLRMHQS
ncbi:MAG TPA: hypothetical protein VGE07_27470 [Herpetosiphonaceae bacterium]